MEVWFEAVVMCDVWCDGGRSDGGGGGDGGSGGSGDCWDGVWK